MTDLPPSLPPPPPIFVPAPAPAPDASATKDERTWAMVAHLSQFVQFIGIPGVCGPLVVYFAKTDSPFVRRHAKQAIFFNLGLLVVGIAAAVFAFLTCGAGIIIAIPLGLVLAAMGVVFPVIAGLRANDGGEYKYPITGSMAS